MASSGTPTSTRWPTRCAGDGWAELCAAAPSADREQRRQEAAPTHFLPVPFGGLSWGLAWARLCLWVKVKGLVAVSESRRTDLTRR